MVIFHAFIRPVCSRSLYPVCCILLARPLPSSVGISSQRSFEVNDQDAMTKGAKCSLATECFGGTIACVLHKEYQISPVIVLDIAVDRAIIKAERGDI